MRQILSQAYKAMPAPLKRSVEQLRAAIARYDTCTINNGVGAGLKMHSYRARHYLGGTNEEPVQQAFVQHLSGGDVFYDIGANVGFFTLIGARLVGRNGHVYAFEPVLENIDAIKRNVWLNQLDNVTLVPKAVSRRAGEADLTLTKHPGGAALCSGELVPSDATGVIRVGLVCLDDLVKRRQIRPPAIIKLDVEGAELEALAGMEQTLREHRPMLIYEIDDNDPQSFSRRRAYLDHVVRSFGYDITHLDESYKGSGCIVGHAVASPSQQRPPDGKWSG